MNTNSRYVINSITETGNKAIVNFSLQEGTIEEVEDRDIVTNEVLSVDDVFVSQTVLKNSDIVFNYFPVPQLDIEYALNDILKIYSGLPKW